MTDSTYNVFILKAIKLNWTQKQRNMFLSVVTHMKRMEVNGSKDEVYNFLGCGIP